MTQPCSRLPAAMLAAPCCKCGVYPEPREEAHVTGTPEAPLFYCEGCCPGCGEESQ
jgi:hypothetical protein